MRINRIQFAVAACIILMISGCSAAGRGSYTEEEFFADSDVTEAGEFSNAAEEYAVERIYVQVCGHIMNPGVYEVVKGTRLFEVIEIAGGPSEEGCIEALWLAGEVMDGDRIYVPADGEETETAVAEDDGLININLAGVEELTSLPGIGAARAGDIIAYRESNGSFASIEDIMKVSGIKEAAFNKIKDKIKV